MILCDLLGIFFVFHLNYEMKCTALEMRKIGAKKNNLKKKIKRHIDAHDYGKSVCSLMSTIFYLEMVVCTLALCITGTLLLNVSC